MPIDMNTKTKILSFLVMFAVAMLMGSCKKESILNPVSNCDKVLEDFTNAYQAYLTDPTVANCETLEDAYNDYVNGCSGWIGYTAYGNMDDFNCSEGGQ
jgi:hypothetical protein